VHGALAEGPSSERYEGNKVIVMGTSANTIASARSQQQASVQQMISGLEKHTQDLASLTIAGTTYSTADLQTTLQARLDALTYAQSKKAEWQAAVKADYAERASTKVFQAGLRQALLVAFAGSVDNLADFGLVGRKPANITPQQRVAAALKAKATRAARHTLGKKQKAPIKGDVTGITVTPVVAQPTPAPSPAPTPSPAPSPVT
jgi:hypothetical protein